MKKDILMAVVSACLLGMVAVYGGYENDKLPMLVAAVAEIGLIAGGLVGAFALMKGEER